MDGKQEEKHDSLALEIKVRTILLKRLNNSAELLKAAARKEAQKREERVESVREYKTFEEAQDAYGWGLLTAAEFQNVSKTLESGDVYIETSRTPTELADEMLREFMSRIEREICSFEFELLPADEQARIRKESEERRARMDARKLGRQLCKAGETVFAVIKNSFTFQLEVIQATVFCVKDGAMVLHRPSDPFTTDVFEFSENEWLNLIFRTPEEAEAAKEKMENRGS